MKKKKQILEKLELVSETNLRTFKGGKSLPKEDPPVVMTYTMPDGHEDGDDSLK